MLFLHNQSSGNNDYNKIIMSKIFNSKKYLNPIKFRATVISVLFIFAPLILQLLNNPYIRAQIIFAH